jgi:hypothetical protein
VPAEIDFRRRSSQGFIYGGCGLRTVSCFGGGRMAVVLEEIGGPPPDFPYPHRVFRSFDNGDTWALSTTYFSTHNLWFWDLYSPAYDHLLAGQEGPDQCGPPSGDDLVARSTDGGLTWGSAVPSGAYSFWDSFKYRSLDAGEVWVIGTFETSTDTLPCGPVLNRYDILRSFDGGASFGSPLNINLSLGVGTLIVFQSLAYLGGDVLLAGAQWGSVGPLNYPRVHRTTNRGATWSEIALSTVSPNGIIEHIEYLGNDVVIAIGPNAGLGTNKVFRSTNAGLTWADITGFAMPAGGVPSHIVSMGNGAACLSIIGNPASVPNWRFTTDYGATWTSAIVGTPGYSHTGTVVPRHSAVADDGSVVVVLSYVGQTTQDIFRGVPNEFPVSVSGPCAAYAPPGGLIDAPLGLGFIGTGCPPTVLGPDLCPQECPPDPGGLITNPGAPGTLAFLAGLADCGRAFSTELCDANVCPDGPALVVTPGGNPGAEGGPPGFRSPHGVLSLASRESPIITVPAFLGGLSGCGRPFSTESCAPQECN